MLGLREKVHIRHFNVELEKLAYPHTHFRLARTPSSRTKEEEGTGC